MDGNLPRQRTRNLQYPLAGLYLYNAELWQWYLYVLQLAVPSSGPIPLQHIKPEAIIGKVKLAVPSSGPIPLQLHNQTTKNLSQSVLQYPLAGLFLYNIQHAAFLTYNAEPCSTL